MDRLTRPDLRGERRIFSKSSSQRLIPTTLLLFQLQVLRAAQRLGLLAKDADKCRRSPHSISHKSVAE